METLTLPGFVNAHTHTFQRALRGRAGGGDFWAWRQLMLAEAERQTPELVRGAYGDAYEEMRAAGYTAVGEFHYLGLPEAHAAAEAAAEAGVELVLLLAAYARGGLPRMRQASVADYLRDLEHRLAPGPEVVSFGATPHLPLERVAVGIDEPGEREGACHGREATIRRKWRPEPFPCPWPSCRTRSRSSGWR